MAWREAEKKIIYFSNWPFSNTLICKHFCIHPSLFPSTKPAHCLFIHRGTVMDHSKDWHVVSHYVDALLCKCAQLCCWWRGSKEMSEWWTSLAPGTLSPTLATSWAKNSVGVWCLTLQRLCKSQQLAKHKTKECHCLFVYLCLRWFNLRWRYGIFFFSPSFPGFSLQVAASLSRSSICLHQSPDFQQIPCLFRHHIIQRLFFPSFFSSSPFRSTCSTH